MYQRTVIVLIILALICQVVSICTNYWGKYNSAKKQINFGLWKICYKNPTKSPDNKLCKNIINNYDKSAWSSTKFLIIVISLCILAAVCSLGSLFVLIKKPHVYFTPHKVMTGLLIAGVIFSLIASFIASREIGSENVSNTTKVGYSFHLQWISSVFLTLAVVYNISTKDTA